MSDIILKDLALVRALSLAFGPSGCEEEVAGLIRAQIDGFYDELTADKLGNLIATVRGTGPAPRKRLMLAAHMDEVGFMVSYIEDDGTLKFNPIGGMDPRVLCGRRICVRGGAGPVPGIIGAKPIHLQDKDERSEITPIDKMYLDIGAKSKDEAAALCAVGDFAAFESEFVTFGEGGRRLKGKALDDRLGCALLVEVMREVFTNRPAGLDVCFAFTVREEVGLSGAATAAYAIDPAFCVVLEATAVADIADVPAAERVAALGKGGVLSLMDHGTIYNREFFDFALDLARRRAIPCQVKQYISGGNDAAHIHKSGGGVKTIALSAPTRYLHSAACVADIGDYRTMRTLVLALVDALPF